MAATVTAAIPPVPLDSLQKYLKFLGMSSAGTTCFMEAHQLITIEDMLLFRPSKSQELMKIYNGQQTCQTNKLGMDVQKKLSAFMYWVRDIQRRQEPIIQTFWTQ